MPTTTSSIPDGQGGTITSAVTKDAGGNVTSIETSHTDASGKEIDSEVESITYGANGKVSSRIKNKRGPGNARRTTVTRYDANGRITVIVARDWVAGPGGGTTAYNETHFRNGDPSTGKREEYNPPGHLRRRTHEVYGQGGTVRERTTIDYDGEDHETGRKTERFDAEGRPISSSRTSFLPAERLVVMEDISLGNVRLQVEASNAAGKPLSRTETFYDADGIRLSEIYSLADRGGKGWKSVTVVYSPDGEIVSPAVYEQPSGKGRKRTEGKAAKY